MTLRNIPYTTSSGEWLPHNAGNYTSRSKAMFFFHSLDNATSLGTGTVEFTNFIDLPNPINPNQLVDSLPILDGIVTYNSSVDPGSRIYEFTYSTSSSHDELTVKLVGPLSLATYKALLGDDAGAVAHGVDQANYEAYKNAFLGLIDNPTGFPPASKPPSINPNLVSFNWGLVETLINFGSPVDCTGIVSNIIDYTPISYQKTEVNDTAFFSREEISIKIKLSKVTFPSSVGSGNWICKGLILQPNPTYKPDTLSGNIINTSISVTNPYIEIIDSSGNNLGRYQIKESYSLDSGNFALLVDRTDGEEFQLGSHTGVSISDISVRPRLRVKYRLRDNPSTGIFYKFFSVQNPDSTYSRLNPLGTKPIENKLESDTLAFIESPNQLIDVGGSIEIDMGGAPNLTPLAFGLNTTLDIDGSGNATRLTPWRKAYRFISRFKPKTVDIHQVKTANPNPFDGVVKFKVSQGTARSKPTSVNANHNYPLAISHRPPCIQHSNPGDVVNEQKGFGNILVDYDFDAGMLMSGTYRQDEVTGEYLFAGNGDHFIERENDGFVFEENGLPNAMFFEANLNDAFNDIDYNYDYTGLVSCAKTVIPAYSGEILYFDTTHGFIKNNYTNSDIGITNRTAVFVDITETDEVLRWSGVNYERPDEFWRQTFTTMVVKNKTTNEPLTVFSDYAVLKTDKDNYVVVMYADEGENITINDGDVIEIVFRNKKVLSTWQNSNDIPDPSVPGLYTTLNYRDINQEWIDDVRSPYTEPSLPNFRIESDGTVDGTITIVPDGVLPEGVEFRLYIQDDETTP